MPPRVDAPAADEARACAAWIVALEPWRSLGYVEARLGSWLAGMTSTGRVLAARDDDGAIAGIVALQTGVLLGDFIALLAVRPARAGAGVGRALIEEAARTTFATRRWLYVSVDETNAGARRFYDKLGFAPVGALPDMVAPGRTELLLRLGRAR